jgi:hypothetical protein
MTRNLPITFLTMGLVALALTACQAGPGATGAGAATGLAPGELVGSGPPRAGSLAPEPAIGGPGGIEP